MAWVKLDDDFFSNPKVMRAGRDARDLYLAALCFCNRGLTDGLIPREALRRLAADADIDNVHAAAGRLVDVGLWDTCDDGYQVHDFLEYQPSRERVVATREVRAEAGSRGGKQRAANEQANTKQIASENEANSQTFASENLKQNPTPSQSRPVPVPQPVSPPDPEENERDAPAAPVPLPKYSQVFEVFWREYPNGHGGKVKTYEAWKAKGLDKAGAAEERNAVMAGLQAWKACERWAVKGMVKSADIWVRDRWWDDEPPPPDLLANGRASPNGKPPTITDEIAALKAKMRSTEPGAAIDTTWRTR